MMHHTNPEPQMSLCSCSYGPSGTARPPNLCRLRIRLRTDVDPPQSAGHIVSPCDNFLNTETYVNLSRVPDADRTDPDSASFAIYVPGRLDGLLGADWGEDDLRWPIICRPLLDTTDAFARHSTHTLILCRKIQIPVTSAATSAEAFSAMPSALWHCWLGGRKGIRRVKKLSGELLAWLSAWSEVQIVCIWPSWCHCHSLSLLLQ